MKLVILSILNSSCLKIIYVEVKKSVLFSNITNTLNITLWKIFFHVSYRIGLIYITLSPFLFRAFHPQHFLYISVTSYKANYWYGTLVSFYSFKIHTLLKDYSIMNLNHLIRSSFL